ncbi:MAG: hypothetical protein Q9160_000694 [Pyrenula sp. 1 TL-2023]
MRLSLKTLVLAAAFSNLISDAFARPVEHITSLDVRTLDLEPRVPPVKPKPKPDDPNNPQSKVPGGGNEPDPNAGPYFSSRIQAKVPVSQRNAVFYTDQGAREQMQNLIEQKMGGNGFSYFNVFGGDGRGGRGGNTDGLIPPKPSNSVRFMGIYRGSRGEQDTSVQTHVLMSAAVAQETLGKEVFVVLQRNAQDNQKRTIFDPVERRATKDSDAELGVGQVWHDVELPTLMRNPNVERITVTQKVNGEWITETQWDIKLPNAPARDSVELRSLDDVTEVPKVPGSKH